MGKRQRERLAHSPCRFRDSGQAVTIPCLRAADPKLTTKAANGQDIINYANGINGQYGFLLGQLEGNPVPTQGVKERLAELERLWGALRSEVDQIETVDIAAFNKLLQASKVDGVIGKKKPGTIM